MPTNVINCIEKMNRNRSEEQTLFEKIGGAAFHVVTLSDRLFWVLLPMLLLLLVLILTF